MPTSPETEVLAELVNQKYPISEELWGNFWDRLRAKELRDGEALALACSLTTRTPDGASVSALLRSLRARNPQPDPPDPARRSTSSGPAAGRARSTSRPRRRSWRRRWARG